MLVYAAPLALVRSATNSKGYTRPLDVRCCFFLLYCLSEPQHQEICFKAPSVEMTGLE
jgi:hypothetical protein